MKKQKQDRDDANKRECDHLLCLELELQWEGWWMGEVEKLAAAKPDLYSTTKGTTKCCAAVWVVARQFNVARDTFKRHKAITSKITTKLRLLKLSKEEEIEFIQKRKAELQPEASRLVVEQEQQEAEEMWGVEDEDDKGEQ